MTIAVTRHVFLCVFWRTIISTLIETSIAVAYRFADHTSSHDGHGEMTLLADQLPPTSLDARQKRHWNRTEEILSHCWEPLAGFVTVAATNDTSTTNVVDHALRCYGEVTILGTRQLAYAMNIMEQDQVIFYDLGAGVGRLTTQMYLDQPHRIQKAVGIELSPDRHAIAMDAWHCMTNSAEDAGSSLPIQFIHGDILTEDWHDATHVFLSSLCFPDSVLESLQHAILTSMPSLRVVASLNRLNLLYKHDHWSETEVPIQMSWGPGSAKIYHHVMIMT